MSIVIKDIYNNIPHYEQKNSSSSNTNRVITELSVVQPQKSKNNALLNDELIDDRSSNFNNTSLLSQKDSILPNPMSKLISRKGRMIMLWFRKDESPIICIGPQCTYNISYDNRVCSDGCIQFHFNSVFSVFLLVMEFGSFICQINRSNYIVYCFRILFIYCISQPWPSFKRALVREL